MIVRITFSNNLVMLFGNSYKTWEEQFKDYYLLFKDELPKPENVEVTWSKWISFGGLKWCSHENFQSQLNREGVQGDEPDNPNPRSYAEMNFFENVQAKQKIQEIMS
ncbi:hypothetical protein J2S74_002843 [Evansella vedderi]|uniref:Uncharacterized protein n=1 Tax=Evansella vedderi TaxID=38282 RepID=A0ABT9ZXK3_9BACI|nr:spore protein H [Evansella vedderi]MDQ0255461.1 hypothetical protein [Evansella vedderi]